MTHIYDSYDWSQQSRIWSHVTINRITRLSFSNFWNYSEWKSRDLKARCPLAADQSHSTSQPCQNQLFIAVSFFLKHFLLTFQVIRCRIGYFENIIRLPGVKNYHCIYGYICIIRNDSRGFRMLKEVNVKFFFSRNGSYVWFKMFL